VKAGRVRLGALSQGRFARYLAASSISNVGSGMGSVALAFAVLRLGGASDLGVVLLAREIPIVVFLILGASSPTVCRADRSCC